MVVKIILIIIGFVLLIKGADLFVDGISSTAINLKIPKILISLTIVAFGTSMPELAISFQGMTSGNGNIVLANVIGSTIVNTMLVVGISAIITPIKVKSETIKNQLPIHLATITLFSILFLDEIMNKTENMISRSDGLILFLSFLAFLYYIYNYIKRKHLKNNDVINEVPKYNKKKSIIYSIVGLILVSIGSNLAVNNCTQVASSIGISDKLITMFVLVIGTSTPEIAMAISSAKKKEFDIILGNIIGTNIFNIGFVLGLPVMIFGNVIATDFKIADMFIMIISGIFIYIFAKDDRTISKAEGISMLIVFITYYIYISI